MRNRGSREKTQRSGPAPQRKFLVPNNGGQIAAIGITLTVLVWIVFGQTLGFEFINYDDPKYIMENIYVLNGLNWPDVKWAFTTGHTGYAHPVTWLTHQFDCQLFGLWAGGHHLTSVIIHAINVLLAFLLFWRVTRQPWPSAFVAALFAIHPLRVESVAWVAERKDVLSGFFFLLTLHAYTSYAARPRVGRYLLALGLFVLGILSKPMLVTVPCVLLLFDYWPLRRLTFPPGRLSLGRLILEKVPFVLIAMSWSLLTFIIQKESGAVAATARIGIADRIANALFSYTMYIWNTIWPKDLALFYPYPTISVWALILSGALLVSVSVLGVVQRQTSPYLIVGWLWYLGMLVPVIGLIQVGLQSRGDRYTYLAQIGLWILVTWGALELLGKWRVGRSVLIGLAVLIVTGASVQSYVQTSFWRNSETVWSHALVSAADNSVARGGLGEALQKQGRFDQALVQWRRALELYPDSPEYNGVGETLLKMGQVDDAIAHFRKAIELCPDCPEAQANLGNALISKGNWTEAITAYRIALRSRPDYAIGHSNLGISLAEAGKTEEALAEFREALRIDRDFRDAHSNLATLLLRLGRNEEALPHLREALRLKPDDEKVKAQLRQLGTER